MRVPAQPHTPARPAVAVPRPNMLIGRFFTRHCAAMLRVALGLLALMCMPRWVRAQHARAAVVVADASAAEWAETGTASWYGPGFAGRPTASGETYDPHNLTAAHRSLPLGSLVRVHNLDNDRHMVVRINDRGPFVRGRVIDVSQAAAEVLGFRTDGLTKVRITPVAPPPAATPAATTVRNTPSAPAPTGQDTAPSGNSAPDKSGGRDKVSSSRPGSGSTTPTAATAATPVPVTEEQAAADPAPAFVTESTLREQNAGSNAASAAQYYLQFGAFRDSRHAQELVQSAGPLGVALHVEAADGMYKVVAGPFESSAAAQEAADEIQRTGMNAFVRRGR